MHAQRLHNSWCVALTALVLVLALLACSPFGKVKGAATLPTETPPPTETPLPVLPTYTHTVVPPTPTATSVPATPVKAQAQATATPTPTSPPPTPTKSSQPVLTAPPAAKKVQVPTFGNVIQNGGFEGGFSAQGVATGWTAFSNDHAVFAWVDETRPEHVSHEAHAQLMQIMGPGQADRFVGIYQTVDVVAGQTYTLTLHGLIRSSTAERSETPYGHRLQWAIDESEPTNWPAVNQEWAMWTDPGWNDVKLDADNPPMNAYVFQVTPKTSRITLYVRGWTKWSILSSEAKFYVDGISLVGPIPGQETTAEEAPVGGGNVSALTMPTTGGTGIWVPLAGGIAVLCLAAWETWKRWAHA